MSNSVHKYRVYYEDTDAGGIVYYANYLKFAERARTDLLRDKGYSQSDIAKTLGIKFIVKSAHIHYHKPALLDDEITVETVLQDFSKTSMTMLQILSRKSDALAEVTVKIVCVNDKIKPVAIPQDMLKALNKVSNL